MDTANVAALPDDEVTPLMMINACRKFREWEDANPRLWSSAVTDLQVTELLRAVLAREGSAA
jgi:hypothetical protein